MTPRSMDAMTNQRPEERHFKRGRWYRVGDREICIFETTLRGFLVLERPCANDDKQDEEELASEPPVVQRPEQWPRSD